MALVKGTNCGFVTVAPTADPSGGSSGSIENYSKALKAIAPAGATKIIEIGWYCSNATGESNFEVGIYDHNVGDNNPEAVVGSLSQTNAKGTTAGWKRVTGLNIPTTVGNTYWIAVQVDWNEGTTNIDYDIDAGEKEDYKAGATLENPWGVSGGTNGRLTAIYAVYEVVEGGQDGPYVY